MAELSVTRISFNTLEVSVSDTEIGLNLGAFFDVLKSDDFQFYIDPKIIIGGLGSFSVSGGILF